MSEAPHRPSQLHRQRFQFAGGAGAVAPRRAGFRSGRQMSRCISSAILLHGQVLFVQRGVHLGAGCWRVALGGGAGGKAWLTSSA